MALAAALTGMAMAAVAVLIVLGDQHLASWISVVATTFLPLSVGAAILRYRLFDLDRLVSRTLAYGLLTMLLGSVYALGALGLGQFLGRDTPLVVAAATLAVAAVFQPARRRVQRAADRPRMANLVAAATATPGSAASSGRPRRAAPRDGLATIASLTLHVDAAGRAAPRGR